MCHAEAYQPYATKANGSACQRIMHAIVSPYLLFVTLYDIELLSRDLEESIA
jgi:hypothetical protein